jgi:transcriptional regulator with XRE-family HTH domain
MTFGAYLTELRKARRIAKNALAKAIGVPFSTVNNWELHGAAPNQANMQKLIAALKPTAAEKAKLTELWLAIPRGEDSVDMPPPLSSSAPASARPSGDAEVSLEALLTRAIVPGRHTMFDALAAFAALRDAAPLVGELGVGEDAARLWLDAAAALRERGTKASAGLLLAMVVASRKNDGVTH